MGWTRRSHNQRSAVCASRQVFFINASLLFVGLLVNLFLADASVILCLVMVWCLWCFDVSNHHRLFLLRDDQAQTHIQEHSAFLGCSVQIMDWSGCEVLWWAWPFVVLQTQCEGRLIAVWLMDPSVQPFLIDLAKTRHPADCAAIPRDPVKNC